MAGMNRKEQASARELESLFAAARRSGNVEVSRNLRNSILDSAEAVLAERAAVPSGRGREVWWTGLLSWSPVWRPVGVLAASALLGFGFGFVFADSVELVAAEFTIADAELPAADIFSDLEQVMLEG